MDRLYLLRVIQNKLLVRTYSGRVAALCDYIWVRILGGLKARRQPITPLGIQNATYIYINALSTLVLIPSLHNSHERHNRQVAHRRQRCHRVGMLDFIAAGLVDFVVGMRGNWSSSCPVSSCVHRSPISGNDQRGSRRRLPGTVDDRNRLL